MKFNIINQVTSVVAFQAETEVEVMDKLREPAMYENREAYIVKNTVTLQFEYAWRVLICFEDITVFN